MPSISTYILGMFCLQTNGKTNCLARSISCCSRLAMSAPILSAVLSMALAVTSNPASAFSGSQPRPKGALLPTTASMRRTSGDDSRPAMSNAELDRPGAPSYCTVTVTCAIFLPYWLVEKRPYVVVAAGVTTTLVPRTGPTCGLTIL